jgi:hypothetical protein
MFPIKDLTMTLNLKLIRLIPFGVALLGCTPAQQAQAVTVENAVFTVEQTACLAANSGMFGTSTAVQDLSQACNIATQLQPYIVQVSQSFLKAQLKAKK